MNERVTITQTGCSKNIDKDACWSSRWWQVSTSIIHTHFYTHAEREAWFPSVGEKTETKIYTVAQNHPSWRRALSGPQVHWPLYLSAELKSTLFAVVILTSAQLCLVTCTFLYGDMYHLFLRSAETGLHVQWSGKEEATGREGPGLGIWSHHFPKRISPLLSLPDWVLLSSHTEVTLGKGNGLSTDGR